jgi:hypothetical protein
MADSFNSAVPAQDIVPTSPVLAGVNAITAAAASWHGNQAIANGGMAVADWASGLSLAVTGVITDVNAVKHNRVAATSTPSSTHEPAALASSAPDAGLPASSNDAQTPPPLLNLKAVGCFAWSPKEKTFAYIQTVSSIAHGCHSSLAFLGATPTVRYGVVEVPPQCLDAPAPSLKPSDFDAVHARVAASYEALPRPSTTIQQGATATVGTSVLSLERKRVRHVAISTGSWDVFDDEVILNCGGRRSRVMLIHIEGADSPSVSVVDTGTPWLALWYKASWGLEGEYGSRVDIAAIDRATCAVVRP